MSDPRDDYLARRAKIYKAWHAIVAYIVSENVRRRHLNAGQRAILLAIAYPDVHPGKKQTSFNLNEVNTRALSQARTIVNNAPDLAEAVLT